MHQITLYNGHPNHIVDQNDLAYKPDSQTVRLFSAGKLEPEITSALAG